MHYSLCSILLLFLLFTACNNSSDSTTKDSAETAAAAPETATPLADNTETDSSSTTPPSASGQQPLARQELVFSWVNNLNVRAAPKTSAEIVAQVKESEPLIYTGQQTDFKEEVTLRGITYNEPWIKVITADKQSGWVFRGAVKRKGEDKGTALTKATHIRFPHFGNFNLARWTRLSNQDQSGGDAENNTQIYASLDGQQILEISQTDVGEYGYSRSYKLMDQQFQLLKFRALQYETDPALLLTEKVYDLEAAKVYRRSQPFKKHYMQLKSKPLQAKGEFNVEELSTAQLQQLQPDLLELEAVAFADWPKTISDGDGCSCSYRPDKNNYKLDVFISNAQDHACVKFKGELILLKGNHRSRRSELSRRAYEEPWIVLNERGKDLFFDQEVEMGEYEDNRNMLIQALLLMEEMPKEISVKNNGQIGMGHRGEIGSMCEEALQMAKAARKRGEQGIPMQLYFSNDRYECILTGKVDGKNDSGGRTYRGILALRSRDGSVRAYKEVWGACAC
ncbi:MAG: SH3 domain-containing protein [Bacteroidota bacterium]